MTTVNDIEFIIPCGGHGTRNYPHSKSVAHKSLLPFGDCRLIDVILKDIVAIGGRHITIVCSDQETINQFQWALATDKKTEQKLREGGRNSIADALRETFLPDDVDLKFIVQGTPIGTAHVLGLAHQLSHDRHGMMIFPDDIILSIGKDLSHFGYLVREFLKNDKQVLMTAIEKDDVSNNAIIHEGRLIEKPKMPYNHFGIYSPIIIPKAILDSIEQQTDTYEKTGKLPENLPMKEWVYTDGINYFLDNSPDGHLYELRTALLREGDMLLDTGTLPLYEKALILSFLKLSRFKVENAKFVRQLLTEI